MEQLKKLLNPQEILFVADAMTGQDAVNSAKDFHNRLGITGVILTKMDGDARGGAALSIRHVTGQPIKFIGTGEKPDAFEPFHPDRIVGRILGMGDMLSLIEKAEATLDRKKPRNSPKRRCSATASRSKTSAISSGRSRRLGSHGNRILKMLPSVGPFAGMQQAVKERRRKTVHAPRGHHQLDDAERAPRPRDHQRHPAQAHRHRLRHLRTGSQPAPAPILRKWQRCSNQMGKGGLAKQMMRGGMGAMGLGGRQKFGR